jgi:hypothetical protein
MISAQPNVAANGGQSDPPADRIPRPVYLGRILWLCFFPIFTVVVGAFVLLRVQQAREALLSFADDDGVVATQAIAFELAFLAWMVSAWYVARLLVGARFHPDLIGRCESAVFAKRLTDWLPRLLALIAGIPVALWIAINLKPLWLGVMLIASTVLVFIGLVFRRTVGKKLGYQWARDWKPQGNEDFEHIDGLGSIGRGFILALFVLSFGLWLAVPIGMESVARPLGAPALLLFALMSWTLFGGFILTYWPKSVGRAGLAWVPGVAVILFYVWNENHPVFSAINPGDTRPKIEDAFRLWLQQRPDPTAPVIFVATAGGASRAAYWTTAALGKLEDQARDELKVFSGNVFVISSISGGSLGAAAFITAIDQAHRHPDASASCLKIRALGESFTGNDHLATVLGFMLFPDLLQRFLPFPWKFWDRSRGLEEVWARDWMRTTSLCRPRDAKEANPWERPFTALHQGRDPKLWLPNLALNSTALNAGMPVLQADFILQRTDDFDLLGGSFATQSITLAQAVHNSARFPYVSPAGVVKVRDPKTGQIGDVWDRLGDGGYVEASGALILTQIIQALVDAKLIRDPGPPGHCPSSSALEAGNDCYITSNQIRVLVLDNAPTAPAGWLCGDTGSASKPPIWGELSHNTAEAGSWWYPPVRDSTEPIIGAFSTRGGRAVTAQVDLLKLVGGCSDRFAELRLPEPKDISTEPSMNWMLSKSSRTQMDDVLDHQRSTTASYRLLGENLERVRTWMVLSSAQ